MLAIAAFAATAVSCGKEGEEEHHGAIRYNAITVTLENLGGDDPGLAGCVIKLVTGDDHAFTETLCGDDGFTLALPAGVEPAFLDELQRDGVPPGLTISDPGVKITTTWLEAYRAGQYIGDFYHGTGEWKGYIVYVNGDVEMTGSFTDEEGNWTYNARFKKGWNVMYEKVIEKENWDDNEYEAVTRVPEGARWCFEPGGDGV